jgi:zinc protease
MSRAALLVLVVIVSTLAACSPSMPASPRAEASLGLPSSGNASAQAPVYRMRETPDDPVRSSAPPLGDPTPFVTPPIHAFHLGNGVPVLFLEHHMPGLVRVEVMLRTQPAPLGANAMAARGVWLGTKTMSQSKLRAANDADAATMSAEYDWGWIRVMMTSTPDRIASSIARLADVVLAAAFPAGQYVPAALRVVDEKAATDDAPGSIAARVAPMALYGSQVEDDWKDLRADDVGGLWRDQIARAYEAALDPSSATILVLGDATESALRPLLEKGFGAWRGPGKHAPSSESHPVAATSSPRLVVVDHPGTDSHIEIVGEGPKFASADWTPMTTLCALFKGSKGRGASVPGGVAVSLYANPVAPRVAVTTDVPTERTAETLGAIDRVLRELKTAEIAPGALDSVRRALVLDEPSWTWTLGGETDLMEGLVVQRVSVDDVSKRKGRLLAVTAEDLRRVSTTYLDPDHMKVIVVGDWTKIRDQLVGLSWGPIEVRTVTGVVSSVEPGRGP